MTSACHTLIRSKPEINNQVITLKAFIYSFLSFLPNFVIIRPMKMSFSGGVHENLSLLASIVSYAVR